MVLDALVLVLKFELRLDVRQCSCIFILYLHSTVSCMATAIFSPSEYEQQAATLTEKKQNFDTKILILRAESVRVETAFHKMKRAHKLKDRSFRHLDASLEDNKQQIEISSRV